MNSKLDLVNGTLAYKIRQVLNAMLALGYSMVVVQGLRTAEYQHELWLQGRDAAGNIIDTKKVVTNADGVKIKSNHQSGRAVDCAFLDENGKVTFDDKMPWALYGAMGKVIGLKWGGDFSFRDLDHLELA